MKISYVLRLSLLSSVTAWGCGSGELDESEDASGTETSDTGVDTETPDQGFVAHYFSPWAQAYMHFDDGSGWTELPGLAMSPEEGSWVVYEHAAGSGSVEFVFNDGAETWDNNGEMNYTTSLSEFWVIDGMIYEERPGVGPDTGDTPYCMEVDCANGVCNDAEQRCDCDAGYLYDPSEQTCIEDLCYGVDCGFGELCDPDNGSCLEACVPDTTVGDFTFCEQLTQSSIAVLARYDGAGQLDLSSSTVRLNDVGLDAEEIQFEQDSQTIAVTATGLEPSKYSYLFRMRNDGGQDLLPLFVPMWVGEGVRYSDFSWKDGIMYQIMTDRFSDGDPGNNIDNSQGTLSQVEDQRSQWQGGDFRGVIDKIKDGYFTDMGINALWISSPLLNSHNSQPAVELADSRRFSSYHSYHPIVTGYTHLDDFGYDNPIEPAFGTEAELHELVHEAHVRGIRVVPDFVANHVQSEAQIYADHADWFFNYNPCDGNWDAHRIDCWFTTEMPDFDFSNPAAVQVVVDHAIWLIEEYNFDGFRADALKHMDDGFVRALKTAVVEQVETTVDNHGMSDEPTVFYMVGESLGGWARYHVRDDMVQGQVDEAYYQQTTNALLNYSSSVRDLANFAIPNDTAYLQSQPIFGGEGGYAGAVMGNFFGNHDQWRALTVAGGDYGRLRLAQTFLFTSPGNIPMLYQGDDIGTFGEQDPDNRAMQRFAGLAGQETASLENVQKLGVIREEHVALRRGSRETVALDDYFWVYRVSAANDEVYVAINRDTEQSWDPPAGFTDALGNCNGSTVPSGTSCVFVQE